MTLSSLRDINGARYGHAELVQRLRDWLATPKVNRVLLERKIFAGAYEIGIFHDRLHELNVKQLAMFTQRMLSNRYVRRRILALAPDRRVARMGLDAIRDWADEASSRSRLALPN